MRLDTPLFSLDPFARDVHAEAARLRSAGPIVPVEALGVPVWAVSHYATAEEILTDPRFFMNSRHWAALRRGEVPEKWPLMKIIMSQNMGTADGEEHRRLRGTVARGFTPRAIASLRPTVERITDQLLDGLAALGAGQVVDYKEHFAVPLPMKVICELFGVRESHQAELHRLCDGIFTTTAQPAEITEYEQGLYSFMVSLVAEKSERPGDDLTSTLVRIHETSGDITHGELIDSLILVLAAGHQTTINFFTNAMLALLSHPDQLSLVRAGTVSWDDVVEEALRWDSPVGQSPFRYPGEDVEIAGVQVRRGEPIIMSYAAIGRDPARHGADALRFDVSRRPRHLSFGQGPHFCVGAPLARLEAGIALPAFFSRFDAALAVPPEQIRSFPSLALNGVMEVPIRITPR